MTADPKNPSNGSDRPTPPHAAADQPPSGAPGEPIKGEVSRTDAPGAGVSTAPPGEQRREAPAPTPENPTAAQTATTAETSSATGQPTAPADDVRKAATSAAAADRAAPKPAAPPKPAAKPAAGESKGEHKAAAAPAAPPDPPPSAELVAPPAVAALQAALGDAVTQVSFWVGDWTVIVPVGRLLDVARFLRDDPRTAFDFCSDVTASDWPLRPQRFDVVYCLYSTRLRQRIRVKVHAGADEPVPSVTGIWPAANWLEREVWDLFGVNFTGHPDRRRILMPEDWQGHPQRKDYPLEGPGELLMENPLDWLKLRQARDEAEIE